MASPMPEEVTIPIEEYSNLLMTKDAADYVYGIIAYIASEPDEVTLVTAQEFARNLLDEWTK